MPIEVMVDLPEPYQSKDGSIYLKRQMLTQVTGKLALEKEERKIESRQGSQTLLNPRLNRNPDFVGRESELNNLDLQLLPKAGDPSSVCTTIYGIGGIGKTELALEWFYQKSYRFSAAFWLDASEPAQLAKAYATMAEKLGVLPKGEKKMLIDSQRKMTDWFQAANSPWLVCFDGVQDAELLRSYWPQGSFGRVLITTRNDQLEAEQSWKAHKIQLGGLSDAAAVQLLTRAGGYDLGSVTKERTEVLNYLQNIPLAIDHMGGVIDKQDLALATFRENFELRYTAWSQQDMRGEKTPWEKDRCRYGKPLAQSWRTDGMDPSSLRLLNLLAFFRDGGCPVSLLIRCKGVSDTTLLFQDKEAVEKAWDAIQKSSIFPGPFTDKLTVHPCILRQFRMNMSIGGWLPHFSTVVDGLSAHLNNLNEYDQRHQVGHSAARMELLYPMESICLWYRSYLPPVPRKTCLQLARLFLEWGT